MVTEAPATREVADYKEISASGRRYRLQQSAIDIAILFVGLQILSVIFALVDPSRFAYLNSANITVALQNIPLLGIPALGVGILMIAGEFDLSVGANYIFSSIVVGQLSANGMNQWLAVLVGLIAGTVIGLLNGVITLKLKIPSFITTLGTLGIWNAATLFYHGASSQTYTPTGILNSLLNGNFGPVPAPAIWMLVLAVGCYALLQRHRIGNHVFASGGGPAAANATGVNVVRTKMLAFGITGFMAAVGGILAAASVGNIAPASADSLALNAIAACVVGGLLLTGGKGTVLGIVIGAFLLYWIQDVLLLLGAPGFYLSAFVGALIIAASVFYRVISTRRV
ncbi:MAG: ABC transporter permease [Nitrospiraceae bacterium]|nr:ABC transporter permease [Nitrospiraceae bacterium]